MLIENAFQKLPEWILASLQHKGNAKATILNHFIPGPAGNGQQEQ